MLKLLNKFDQQDIIYLMKSVSKLPALNRKIVAISRPWIEFLSFRYRAEVLIECGFNLEVLWFLLALTPKLRCESLITVDYKNKEILLFAFLDAKLWLKEGDY